LNRALRLIASILLRLIAGPLAVRLIALILFRRLAAGPLAVRHYAAAANRRRAR